MCRLLPRLLLLALLFVHTAQAGNVALVVSESSGPYAEFNSIFQDALDGSDWKISTQGMVDSYDNSPVKPDLIVAAGSSAFRQVMSRVGNTPVIATLIPRQAYDKTLAEFPGRNRRTTAIFLDQPPARLASFLRHALPGRKRVGMLFSGETQNSLPLFRQASGNAGLSLDSEESEGESGLLPTLSGLLPRIDVLLATPDSRIYRRENTKAILVTTYRHQRPVIAFSAAFVSAGALAALYSTPAQIARQTADLTLSFSTTLPPPMSPSQFAVAINHNVAQALELSISDEASIRRAMLADKEAR